MRRVFSLLVLLLYTSMASAASLQSFPFIYEPSGVTQNREGQIVLVEDDGKSPIHLLHFIDVSSVPHSLKKRSLTPLTKVDDLEGITIGKGNDVFVITSHSARKNGQRKKSREQLLLLNIKGDRIINELSAPNSLFLAMEENLSDLMDMKTKNDGAKINVEALAYSKTNDLLIGLRSPLVDKKSCILVLSNPYEIFSGSPPKFRDDPILLNLMGGGIRAMTYDKTKKSYLIANEIRDGEGKQQWALWEWSGKRSDSPKELTVPGVPGIKNVEGIAIVTILAKKYLLLVCDNGSKKKEREANYLLLDYKHI